MASSDETPFATDREDPVYVNDRAHFSIARTIPLPLSAATDAAHRLRTGSDPVRAVSLANGGMLLLRLPLRSDLSWPQRRGDQLPARTGGALYTQTNRSICAVEIELSPWSDECTELVVRPAVRNPCRWSARKLERWFAHAHLAADALRASLTAPPPERAPAIDLTETSRTRVVA
jgi:hypothetical protein